MWKLIFFLGVLLAASCAQADSMRLSGTQPIGFTFTNIPSNSTYYITPGGAGVNQNYQSLIMASGTISNLSVHVAAAPGSGQTDTFTVYVGTRNSMTSTPITCTISNTDTSCSDLTNSASITSSQAWAIQVVTSASATNTAQSSAGVAFRSN